MVIDVLDRIIVPDAILITVVVQGTRVGLRGVGLSASISARLRRTITRDIRGTVVSLVSMAVSTRSVPRAVQLALLGGIEITVSIFHPMPVKGITMITHVEISIVGRVTILLKRTTTTRCIIKILDVDILRTTSGEVGVTGRT